MVRGGVLFGIIFVGCAAPQPVTTVTAVRPVPEKYRSGVDLSMRLGREIAAQDAASTLAADLFQKSFAVVSRAGIRGWVTLPRPDYWTVIFVTGEGESERATHQLEVPRQQGPDTETISFKAGFMDPPRSLTPEEAVRRRALRTVARSTPRGCGQRMNPVVLPASEAGQQGWFVYLLNSSNDPNALVTGGHLRFRVSPDGEKLEETLVLSECLVQRRDPKEQTAGLVLGTPFFAFPNEGHVFTAISQQLPVFLGTQLAPGRANLWEVTPSGEVLHRGEVRGPGSG